MRTQSLAVFATNQFHGRRQQHLLAQNVFQQKTFALIIADFGVRLGNSDSFRAAIDTKGPVQQIKRPVYRVRQRLETARTGNLESHVESANHTDVVNVFLMPAMLDDQLRPALGVKPSHLAEVSTKIHRSGREILVELHLLELQIRDPKEHSGTNLTP